MKEDPQCQAWRDGFSFFGTQREFGKVIDYCITPVINVIPAIARQIEDIIEPWGRPLTPTPTGLAAFAPKTPGLVEIAVIAALIEDLAEPRGRPTPTSLPAIVNPPLTRLWPLAQAAIVADPLGRSALTEIARITTWLFKELFKSSRRPTGLAALAPIRDLSQGNDYRADKYDHDLLKDFQRRLEEAKRGLEESLQEVKCGELFGLLPVLLPLLLQDMPPTLKMNPYAMRALNQMAEKRGRSPQDLLQDIFIEGLWLALSKSHDFQTIRLGKDWIKDKGKKALLVPRSLPLHERIRWLKQRTCRLAEDSLIDQPPSFAHKGGSKRLCPSCQKAELPVVKGKGCSCPHCGVGIPGDTIAPGDWEAPLFVHIEAMAEEWQDQNLKSLPETQPETQVKIKNLYDLLNKRATPKERDVLNLLLNDTPDEEIANLLGCSPETIRVHRYNLGKKFKSL